MRKMIFVGALFFCALAVDAQVQPRPAGSSQITGVSGNGHALATVNGPLTAGDCDQNDANGNLVDSGSPCGSGGSISGLTTSKIPKATSGTAIGDSLYDDGLANANGGTYGGTAGLFAKSFNSTDTVNNASMKFGTGSGGDSTCPTITANVSYLCTKALGVYGSINGGAYSPILTQATAGPLLPLYLNWTFNSGAAVNDAAPRVLAAHAATISTCYLLTTAADATTSLAINIFDNGTTIFSAGAQTVANATAAGTLTTLGSLAITSISSNDKFSVNITGGTSSWVFSVQCK